MVMGSFFFGAGEINADSLYLKIIRSFIIKSKKSVNVVWLFKAKTD